MQKDIRTLAELQRSHSEQNERQFSEINHKIDEIAEFQQSLIKKSFEEITEMKEDHKSIHEELGRHEIQIRTMKRKIKEALNQAKRPLVL